MNNFRNSACWNATCMYTHTVLLTKCMCLLGKCFKLTYSRQSTVVVLLCHYTVYRMGASVKAVHERLALHSTTSESWKRYITLVIFALQLNHAIASLKSLLLIRIISSY